MRWRHAPLLIVPMLWPMAGTTCIIPDPNGPSSVAWEQHIINTGAAISPSVVTTFDFDNDGLIDVIAGYTGNAGNTPSVHIFFQTDPETFTDVSVASTSDLAGITALALGDLDGDTHPDIVAACNGRLVYIHSPADPEISANWTNSVIAQSSGNNINQWNDVAIGNIDATAGLDIVAANALLGRLSWFKSPASNITNGTGWERTDIDASTRTNANGVALEDMNFDGRLDVVSSAPGETAARIAWYANPTNPTTGTWTKNTVGNLTACTRIIMADLNADGRNDVVAINPTGRQVGWYVRPSDATTAWSGYLLTQYTTNQPIDVKAIDLNGDNQLNLVVGTTSASSLRWFDPSGVQTQQWTENNVDDLTIPINRFSLADMNIDGRPDIVAPLQGTTGPQSQIVWYENPLP